jgi:AbrB family looped-hinge helix DNA binding protein
MTSLTVKGQVTIPKAVRDHLGLVPGSHVVWELAEDGRVLVAKAPDGRGIARPVPPRDRFDAVRGSAKAGLSTDEIMALMRGEA